MTEPKITHNATREQALAINCRECGATPGDPCVTQGGNTYHQIHMYRWMDAAEDKDPGPTVSPADQRMQLTMSLLTEYKREVIAKLLTLGWQPPAHWTDADTEKL